MRGVLITVLLTFAFLNVNGQLLYNQYKKEGYVNAAGGPNAYDIDITLKADSTFIRKITVYSFSDFEDKKGKKKFFLVSEDVSMGKWSVRKDTLFLNGSPDDTSSSAPQDIYLIKRKRLKRITLKDAHAIYRAYGKVLSKDMFK